MTLQRVFVVAGIVAVSLIVASPSIESYYDQDLPDAVTTTTMPPISLAADLIPAEPAKLVQMRTETETACVDVEALLAAEKAGLVEALVESSDDASESERRESIWQASVAVASVERYEDWLWVHCKDQVVLAERDRS